MRIIIYGWDDGFNKVQFSKYLIKEYKYNTREAFLFVTNIVEEKEQCLLHDKPSDPRKILDSFKLKYRVEL